MIFFSYYVHFVVESTRFFLFLFLPCLKLKYLLLCWNIYSFVDNLLLMKLSNEFDNFYISFVSYIFFFSFIFFIIWNAVYYFIALGANVSYRNTNGDTVLMKACEKGNEDIMGKLLAQFTKKDILATLTAQNKDGNTCLMKACATGNLKVVNNFLSLSLYLSIRLSICSSIYLSIYSSIYLSIFLFIYLSIYLLRISLPYLYLSYFDLRISIPLITL